MWDAERKEGVLSGFDRVGFTDQKGASRKENTGQFLFMALDLLSKEGLRGEIPRLYRHSAESFSWSLIYLCLSMVESEKGENCTMTSGLLRKWLGDWAICRNAKMGLRWEEHDAPDVTFVYPNARELARFLHGHWLDRYRRQFREPTTEDDPSILTLLFGFAAPASIETPPYVEEEDDTVFQSVLVLHEKALLKREEFSEIRGALIEMAMGCRKIYWSD